MDDIRCYLRALLKALAHVHSHKIIHRDVKPSNFLYDLEKRTGVLVDFGLAHKQKESSSATVSSTSKSAATAQKATNSSRAASVTTAGTEAGASSSSVSMVAPLEQQGIRQAQGQSNKENIEPAPPRNKVESAPTTSVNQPNTHTERTTVLGEERQTSSSQSARLRNATTAQAPQVMPVAQTPNLASHVRPNPLQAPPSTLPSTPAISQTSIIATNREPGFLKKDNRPSLRVNRAGTRGFRAPEILFRHVRQTVGKFMVLRNASNLLLSVDNANIDCLLVPSFGYLVCRRYSDLHFVRAIPFLQLGRRCRGNSGDWSPFRKS